jgi:hypothetical protein
MQYDRDWVQRLSSEGARVVVRRGGRPIASYAVILEHRAPGELRPRWQTVCLIDNHMDKCHIHKYHGAKKLDPEPFVVGLTLNEELHRAIRYMAEKHEALIAAWIRRRT